MCAKSKEMIGQVGVCCKSFILLLHGYVLELFDLLKNLPEKRNDLDFLTSLFLVVKWGPLHKLPIFNLRGNFQFISEIAGGINTVSTETQDVVLKILVTFCKQVCVSFICLTSGIYAVSCRILKIVVLYVANWGKMLFQNCWACIEQEKLLIMSK